MTSKDVNYCTIKKAGTRRMSAFNHFRQNDYIFIEDERSVPFLVFIV